MSRQCTHYGRWPQHGFTSLKKLRPQSVTSRIQPGSDVIVCAEMDEQWGYVGAKSRQRCMILGGVAQMLAPKARTPTAASTDNGKQNTYFSSLDNMVAQGNVLPVLYGEMRVGSRVVSQEISTADEGDGGQVVVIGR